VSRPKDIVVVGGGAGGSIVASRVAVDLRGEIRAGRLNVTLVTEKDDHLYQPGLLYVAFGEVDPQELHRPQSRLMPPEVRLVVSPVRGVDPQARVVYTQSGERIPYDVLVLATGSVPSMEEVPGLAEGGHEFYTEAGALRLRQALSTWEGGRLVLTVGVPHKCPVAPLEFTFLVEAYLRARGLRERTEIVYTYPLGRVHTLESVAPWAQTLLEERGVRVETFFNLESVDPQRRIARSMEGLELDYDLLVAVPPHRGASFLTGGDVPQGLAGPGGWIPTDRYTLEVKGFPGVYALGDATDLPVSKAGSTAHYQAEVLAQNLVSMVRGEVAGHRYDGKVYCFIEAGNQEATYITFDYQHPPRPVPPSRLLHAFKLAFNRAYWLMPQGIA
jgi:sulfide:quinone oxidoreductase